jgi:hypothetical protein
MRSGRRAQPARGPAALEAGTIVLGLGASAIALGWLAGVGTDAAAEPPSASARVITETTRLGPTACFFRDVTALVAEPQLLVPPAPKCTHTLPPYPGRGSLDIALMDAAGRPVVLGAIDTLVLTALNPPRDGTVEWHVPPSGEGRFVVPRLLPGRYAARVSTGILGVLEWSDVQVNEGEPTHLDVRHGGPPLEGRLAIRIPTGSLRGPAWPEAQDLWLHGPRVGVRRATAAGADVFHFDNLPAGRYDLELRVDATQSRWMRGLMPGSLRETLLVSGLALEPSSTAQPTAR